MTNRPKQIGTAAETAVVRTLRTLGFPHAERRALTGALDQGDITGCPGLVFEVKGGEAAKVASDAQITAWLAETEAERLNAGADIGVLVLQRRGVGASNAGRWWAVVWLHDICHARGQDCPVRPACEVFREVPARLLLADVTTLLRAAGYGEPLDITKEAIA